MYFHNTTNYSTISKYFCYSFCKKSILNYILYTFTRNYFLHCIYIIIWWGDWQTYLSTSLVLCWLSSLCQPLVLPTPPSFLQNISRIAYWDWVISSKLDHYYINHSNIIIMFLFFHKHASSHWQIQYKTISLVSFLLLTKYNKHYKPWTICKDNNNNYICCFLRAKHEWHETLYSLQ